MMRGYAEADGCRRAFVLGYFGEAFEPPCGRCDVCDAGAARPAARGRRARSPWARAWRTPEWGSGTVQRAEDEMLTVVFDSVGYKTLALDVVEEKGLLEPTGEPG